MNFGALHSAPKPTSTVARARVQCRSASRSRARKSTLGQAIPRFSCAGLQERRTKKLRSLLVQANYIESGRATATACASRSGVGEGRCGTQHKWWLSAASAACESIVVGEGGMLRPPCQVSEMKEQTALHLLAVSPSILLPLSPCRAVSPCVHRRACV